MSLSTVEASSKKVPSRRTGVKSSSSSTSNKAMQAKLMGTYYDGPFDFEIVGLYKTSYGRSCTLHTKCGEHLYAGDFIQLVPIETTTNQSDDDDDDENENDDPVEGTIKVMKLVNDIPQCIVGYIPFVQCNVLKRKHGLFQDGDVTKNKKTIVAIVNDIYQYSDNTYKVFTSERHSGMASCRLCTNTTTTTTTSTK